MNSFFLHLLVIRLRYTYILIVIWCLKTGLDFPTFPLTLQLFQCVASCFISQLQLSQCSVQRLPSVSPCGTYIFLNPYIAEKSTLAHPNSYELFPFLTHKDFSSFSVSSAMVYNKKDLDYHDLSFLEVKDFQFIFFKKKIVKLNDR